MFKLAASLNTAFRKLQKQIESLSDRLSDRVRSKSGKWGNRALTRLKTEPGPPQYPIRWASARQRRAFFATNGFGGGIPHRRTNKIISGWHAEHIQEPNGGRLFLANPHKAMTYVQYKQVQPFHLDTGYVQVDDVVDDFVHDTSEGVRLSWHDVSKDAVRNSAIRKARR